MTAHWKKHPVDHDYFSSHNWVENTVPTLDAAIFGASKIKTISFSQPSLTIGTFSFAKNAENYVFNIGGTNTVTFADGPGVVVKGGRASFNVLGDLNFGFTASAGKAHINNIWDHVSYEGTVTFSDSTTAGRATIVNGGILDFGGNSTAGNAKIVNKLAMEFFGHATAGNAVITSSYGIVHFIGTSNAGQARLIGDHGEFLMDGSGPDGNNFLTAGSIEGNGIFYLGNNRLYLSSNRSTTVSGPISSGNGLNSGIASLAKGGTGTLTLTHAHNDLVETFIVAGTLNVAAPGAAGYGFISFDLDSTARQTLKIQNAALESREFNTVINDFRPRDTIDLPGLKFHRHANAHIDENTGQLVVKSGHVTDILDFFQSDVAGFKVTDDGHGGTKIVGVGNHARAFAAAQAETDAAPEHSDSFRFKPIAAKPGENLSQDASHHAAPVDHALGLDHALNESVAFYDIDASQNAHALHLASGAGDFGL